LLFRLRRFRRFRAIPAIFFPFLPFSDLRPSALICGEPVFAFPIPAIPAIPRDSGDLFSVPSFF
jgi:hypothetical protein